MKTVIAAILDALLTAAALADEAGTRIGQYRMPGYAGQDRDATAQGLIAFARVLTSLAGQAGGASANDMSDEDALALQVLATRAFDVAIKDAPHAIDELLGEDDGLASFSTDDLLAELGFAVAADEDVPEAER